MNEQTLETTSSLAADETLLISNFQAGIICSLLSLLLLLLLFVIEQTLITLVVSLAALGS